MDAQVVDIGEVEREFQTDMPPLEPLDMNMVKSKNDPFQHSKRASEREQAQRHVGARQQNSSSFVLHRRIFRWDPGDSKVLGWKKSQK